MNSSSWMHHVDSMHHSRHVAASVKSMLMSAWYRAGLRGSGLLGFMAAEAMSQKHAAAYSCLAEKFFSKKFFFLFFFAGVSFSSSLVSIFGQ